MIVHTSLESLESIKNPVVTTGTFDGVHLGHQKIIKKLKSLAEENDGETVLFTFYPHPRMVLFPTDHGLSLISTVEEKTELLREAGLDHLILFPFTKEFSRLSALQYIRDIMVNKIGVHTMVVGYDHHFGRNREGDLPLLNELSNTYDFKVEVISALDVESVNVSSTKVRKAISGGDIETANEYLGYNFFFSGKVVKGEQRGRLLGFKTANLITDKSYKLIPNTGVYACFVYCNAEKYVGMLNIGRNPTFNSNTSKHVEVHILDFDEEIYGEELKIELVKHLREEKKFESVEKLVQQLNIDRSMTRELMI